MLKRVRVCCAGLTLASVCPPASAQPIEQLIGAPGPQTYDRFNPVQQHVHRPTGAAFSADVFIGGDTPPLVGPWWGPPDWTLMRVDASGGIVWQSRLPMGDGGYIGASSIDVLSDGSIVVSGSAESGDIDNNDIGVARVSALGSLLWTTRVYGSSDYSAIAALPGDSCVVVGSNLGSSTVHILSAAGATVVAKVLALAPPYDSNFFLTDVKFDAATGTIVVCGWAYDSASFDAVGVVIRMSTAGAVIAARYVDFVNVYNDPINFEVVSIETRPGGLALAVASEVWNHDDPEFTYTVPAPALVGLDGALNPVWVTQFSSGQFIRPRQGALRRHPSGVLGMLGQYSFGDGGSNIWLARFDEAAGAYQGRHQYGGSANTFPGGLTPSLDAAHPWTLAGAIQSTFSTSDGYLVVTRADGTTGCEEPVTDELWQPAMVNGPLTVLESSVPPVPALAVTPTGLAFEQQVVCIPQPPCPCNLADITLIGGTLEEPGVPDCQLTLDDILVFIDAFNDATGCPGSAPCNLADITESGGTLEAPGSPDGQLSLDDILVFVDAYNEGC